MSGKQNTGNKRGNDKSGGKQKGPNPFAKDPVQKEINAITEERKALSDTYTTKRAEVDALNQEKVQYTEAITKANTYLKENVHPKLNAIKAEEDKIRATLDRQKEDKAKFYEEMNNLLPIRRGKDQSFADHIAANINAVEKELNDLQAQLREISSLKQEKQIVASIEKVRAKRAQIEALKDQKVSAGNAGERLKEIREKKAPLKEDAKKHYGIIDENKTKREALNVKIRALRDEMTKINEKRDELNKQYEEKRKVLDEKWTVYKAEQDVIRKKKKAEYEERKARYQKEKEEEERLRKLEEANRPPMLKEVAACDAVISYLDRLKYNKKKLNTKIAHSLDAFTLFSAIGMTPPQRGKQVQEAKDKAQEKKAEVLAAQAEAMKKRAEEAAAKAEEEVKNAEVAVEAEKIAAEPVAEPATEPVAEPAKADVEEPATEKAEENKEAVAEETAEENKDEGEKAEEN